MSTEGRSPAVSLEEALFSGPAPDGGLYVPETIPRLSPLPPGAPLAETALRVAESLFADDVAPPTLQSIVSDALDFEIPLVPVDKDIQALELFHGPTLAFKDVGARFMARLMLHFLATHGPSGGIEPTVLVATSGDTGSAVAQAFYRLAGIRVVVLFPRGRVSELQRKLFSTLGENVSAVSVEGTFDDCQRMVKQAFADTELTRHRPLVSANSINVGRLLPQTFYYFHLQAQLPRNPRRDAPGESRPLIISTPSGNFGNLTAGLLAKRMGLPVARFVAATNVNDVVPEYLESGRFRPRASVETLSNAMDVGNPSNLARIRWLYGGSVEEIRKDVLASVHDDAETLKTIRRVYNEKGYRLDPHGAVGYLGALEGLAAEGAGARAVFLATAHPAKFRETVERALERPIELPPELEAVTSRPELIESIPAEYGALEEYLLP